MARQTKAQKIAELAHDFAVRYSMYTESLDKEGHDWKYYKRDVLKAQKDLECLLGTEISLVKEYPLDFVDYLA